MNLRVLSTYDEMSRAAADFTAGYVRNHPCALLCFPSGDTPGGMLKCLVEDALEGRLDLKNCEFVGLDEWLGMDAGFEGSCRHYMDQHLFLPLQIEQAKIHFFNGTAPDLSKECSRIDKFIKNRSSIDLIMVGLGLNGHFGLNEPGVDLNLTSHISDLNEITKHTAKKYFSREVSLTRGITLGPRHLLESRDAVIIASGSKKAEIVARVLEQEVSNDVPASIIQKHPDAHVFLDREAAALLSMN